MKKENHYAYLVHPVNLLSSQTSQQLPLQTLEQKILHQF